MWLMWRDDFILHFNAFVVVFIVTIINAVIKTMLLNHCGFPLPCSHSKVIFYLLMGSLFKEMTLKLMKALWLESQTKSASLLTKTQCSCQVNPPEFLLTYCLCTALFMYCLVFPSHEDLMGLIWLWPWLSFQRHAIVFWLCAIISDGHVYFIKSGSNETFSEERGNITQGNNNCCN